MTDYVLAPITGPIAPGKSSVSDAAWRSKARALRLRRSRALRQHEVRSHLPKSLARSRLFK